VAAKQLLVYIQYLWPISPMQCLYRPECHNLTFGPSPVWSKIYTVQKVTCKNSKTIIIKGCDSAEKFTQKILIKTVNYPKRVKRLGQELTDIGWGSPWVISKQSVGG